MAASSATLWKYSLLILTILITVLDVFFITWGVVGIGTTGSVSAANIVALLGLFIIIVSLIGWMASVRRSYILSKLYIILTIVTVIFETILMITLVVRKETFMERASKFVEKKYVAKETGVMDNAHIRFHCCGIDSPQDYLIDNDDVLPKSCCFNQDCSIDDNIFSKGCFAAAAQYYDNKSDNLMLVTVGLVILQVLSIISAYYLIRSIKHRILKRERIIINE